jgi:hypothetical protein
MEIRLKIPPPTSNQCRCGKKCAGVALISGKNNPRFPTNQGGAYALIYYQNRNIVELVGGGIAK